MKKLILTAVATSIVCAAATAQTPEPTVSISARATDLRTALANIFDQAKKSYIFQPNLHGIVYTSLENIEFSKALKIICTNQGLAVDIKDGIYYVHTAGTPAPTTPTFVQPTVIKPTVVKPTIEKPAVKVDAPTKIVKRTPTQKLDDIANSGHQTLSVAGPTRIIAVDAPKPHVLPISVLDTKVTAKVRGGNIRKLLADFGKQANVKIEIGDEVPSYKIDAFLMKTSLKYALDKITDAAGLEYRFTENNSIAITKTKRVRVALND